MRSESSLQQRAYRLLDRASIDTPPVPVDAVAAKLGVQLRFEPDDSDISGALYQRGGVTFIAINSNDAWVRQRFSIAHEIGHLILHAGGETDQGLFIDRYYPTERANWEEKFNRDRRSGQALFTHEIEANKFAACLLMPRKFLLENTRGLREPLRAEDVYNLARRYEVSQQAMLFRLQNLRVLVEET